MVLIIDNYDSFTYNLVQAIGGLHDAAEIKVILNDELTADAVESLRPEHIILSPGPCTPNEAGISMEVVRRFAGRIPLLGVCLGHQCIAQVFGFPIQRAPRLMHGKVSQIHHVGSGIYEELPNPFPAARYHSLIVDVSSLPSGFEVTAWTSSDEPMGIRNESLLLEGVQFHPESFLTPDGVRLLQNFLNGSRRSPMEAAKPGPDSRRPL